MTWELVADQLRKKKNYVLLPEFQKDKLQFQFSTNTDSTWDDVVPEGQKFHCLLISFSTRTAIMVKTWDSSTNYSLLRRNKLTAQQWDKIWNIHAVEQQIWCLIQVTSSVIVQKIYQLSFCFKRLKLLSMEYLSTGITHESI